MLPETTPQRSPATMETHPAAAFTAELGRRADQARAAGIFSEYADQLAPNTKIAQLADLDAYSRFLTDADHPNPPTAAELQETPAAWIGTTAGLLAAFRQWSVTAGAAIATVNRRLATVRKYARLAADAGAIPIDEATKIDAVKGYSARAGRNMDTRRTEAEIPTRISAKKATWHELSKAQRRQLKANAQDGTARGRRDALLIALALDHGLRIGEIVRLTRRDFDLEAAELTFYRPKVDKTQRHKMTPDTIRAIVSYIMAGDAPADADAPIILRSRKDGTLTDRPMDERSAQERIAAMGRKIGIRNLSPHDLRHTWTAAHAERASHGDCSLFDVQEAGGWSSLAIVRRYVKEREIANDNLAISL